MRGDVCQVDVDGLGLHDYRDIIKHPMDLGTIQKRLKPGVTRGWGTTHYKSTTDVLRDVERVWFNCREYNEEGDPVW
jgi:bromodomain-containing protein 4